MKRWLASDLHLNHLNILRYCPARRLKDNGEAPTQSDVDMMNEHIISNWNGLISNDDEVYITGDVAMGSIDKAPALIQRLNGKKTLIFGNHDRTLKRHPNLPDLFVYSSHYFEKTFNVDGIRTMLCMSHFPMAHWNGQSQGSMMIHGHLHGAHCGVPGRIKDVGIDTNGLYPYDLDEVVRGLRKIDVRKNHHGEEK